MGWLDASSSLLFLAAAAVAVATAVFIARLFAGHRRSLAALREREERYRLLFERSVAGMYFSRPEGSMIECNEAFARIYGHDSRERAVACSAESFHPHPEARQAFLDRLREQGGLVNYETHARRADGTTVWTLENVILIETGSSPIIGGALIDITDRKRTYEELRRLVAELEARNAEMERFNYSVSHELKSPLVTIRSFLGLLAADLESQDRQRVQSDLRHLRSAAESMSETLDDLLLLSRSSHADPVRERVSLRSLAQRAMERLTAQIAESGAEIRLSPDLPEVHADPTGVLEVLQNLIENAIKFARAGVPPVIEVGVGRRDGEVVFHVSDRGVGVDPVHQERIFGLFERLDPRSGGTGVGLAIVKRIVGKHGGRVWVESPAEGPGARFCFTLPPEGPWAGPGSPARPPAGGADPPETGPG